MRRPPRAVEREREEPPPLLAERLLRDERLELGDDQLGVAEVEAAS